MSQNRSGSRELYEPTITKLCVSIQKYYLPSCLASLFHHLNSGIHNKGFFMSTIIKSKFILRSKNCQKRYQCFALESFVNAVYLFI